VWLEAVLEELSLPVSLKLEGSLALARVHDRDPVFQGQFIMMLQA
jgi:hypothetical protein